MKRKTFILGMAGLPVAFNALLARRGSAAEAAPAPNTSSLPDDMTTDVITGDFPPVIYGRTLAEAETTIQAVVERIFRDEDGILRSGVNALTLKAIRPEEIKDRPNGVGTYAENSSIPREAKSVWMTYENAGQASGTYLEALCAKARRTGDPQLRIWARQTVAAIRTLWDNAAANQHPLGGQGRGWFPKPYLGIRNVSKMYECSADQYCDVTLGLHTYYLTLADETEKRQIEEIIVSFAEWWYDHDYCGVYFGQAIWWKRLPWHPMAASYFLYLNALAQSWRPSPKFQRGFDTWLELKATLQPPGNPIFVCMHGITLNCLERLIALRPDLETLWRAAAAYQAPLLVGSVEGGTKAWEADNVGAFAADYLATAHRLMPTAGYGEKSQRHLEACLKRESFYAIQRHRRVSDLDKRQAGDDYRNQFWCEDHVHWLAAYWRNRPLPAGS